MSTEHWTILTSHALVLVRIHRQSEITLRELALSVGITERHVARIINDLLDDGVITKKRTGLRNIYTIQQNATLRRPGLAPVTVREVLSAIESLSK